MQSVVTQTNNQLAVNTDTSKIFIGDNWHENFDFEEENATYDDVNYPRRNCLWTDSCNGKGKAITI